MTRITVLSDVIMPCTVVGAGVRGRNVRRNERTQTINGEVQVNVQWDYTLREYEVGFIAMLLEVWAELEGLHEVTDAGAFGFLMIDPKDSIVGVTEGKLIAYNGGFPQGSMGSGYGEPVLYLFKRYTSVGSAQYRDRPIGRPFNAVIRRNGTPVDLGTDPGEISLDEDTGKVTFVADTLQNISTTTVGVGTELAFPNNTGIVAALAVGQRVYLNGIAGSAASILNGKSHVITAKDTVAFTLTISTTTTGLTATGGTAYKYPQVSDALTWSGEFYVPVHFANDELDWEMVRPGDEESRLVAGPSARLMQILELPE